MSTQKTLCVYREITNRCKEIFVKKMEDYGTSWFILRLPSITDQIMIKALRTRSILSRGVQLVEDKIEEDFLGIINYCIMALIRIDKLQELTRSQESELNTKLEILEKKDTISDKIQKDKIIYETEIELSLSTAETFKRFDKIISDVEMLLKKKNHDYNEAWRKMRVSSMIDIILMKLYRIKKLEDNGGKRLCSEGVSAGFNDIINYAVFCLINLNISE